jgi:acetolactate synthase-1/2/3 large subunit
VAIVGDVARGEKYRPFQVHALPNTALLQQVTKGVFEVVHVTDIPGMVRQAFALARAGEPGPVAVVVPYNLLIEKAHFHCPPPGPWEVPFDEAAVVRAVELLRCVNDHNRFLRVGIYAGFGCMDASADLIRVAELLQAPVATSVSGKGAMDDCHSLAVGWGYGAQGTRTAEQAFARVDLVLAIGVKFSEVSTAFYSLPHHPHMIQVDTCAANLGQIMKPDVCVHAEAGLFLQYLLAHGDEIRRPPDPFLVGCIRQWKAQELRVNQGSEGGHASSRHHPCCGIDPMAFVLALRRQTPPDAMTFVDVTVTEHWAAEVFTCTRPRTYFNPTDNQAMGWSIPAAIGAQRANPARLCTTITGDGCFLMSAMETTTAARECLPVKFFILDDQAYHYMQELQMQAYRRTTATILAHLDYQALAKGWGLNFLRLDCTTNLEEGIHTALHFPGPVLVQVVVDYGNRPVRWIAAARKRYVSELTTHQKVRFLARVGSRSICTGAGND